MFRPRSILSPCILIVFVATACHEVSYPVLPQRTPSTYRLSLLLDMDPEQTSWPGASIVRGVLPDYKGRGWRWTDSHPLFHFHIDAPEGLELEAKITAVDAVLSKTGPQTVKFLINGQTIKSLRLDHPGPYEFRLPLAAALLKRPADTTLELSTEPCLLQTEGPPFCVLLHRIGFTREIR